MLHKMLLISTGGTIAGEVATTKKEESYEIKKADAFSDIIKDTVGYLKRTQEIELDIEPHEFAEVDSSNIEPKHWTGLVDIIKERFDDYDSFVITHGTNTLGYTCAALSFAIANSGKPIILTGSQVPINQPGSDAKTNLDNAIRVAVWNKENRRTRGVICVFGSHIITGTRVKKDTEFDYDAFKTFNQGSIGRIGRLIDIDSENLERHCAYHKSAKFPVAMSAKDLKIENDFDTRIASFSEFPGMDPEILWYLHKEKSIKGFVIRAFGAGDLASRFVPVLERLKEAHVPVVVTTQAPNGNATLQVNEPGQYLKEHSLVIPAYDMSHESQVTKLAWLLAKMREGALRFEDFEVAMIEDVRGEIDVMWESEV